MYSSLFIRACGDYAVIEGQPRLSRSLSTASKAWLSHSQGGVTYRPRVSIG